MSFLPSHSLGSALTFFSPSSAAHASRSYLYTTKPEILTLLSRNFCPFKRISVTEWLPSAYGLGSGKSGGVGRSSLISVSATSALGAPVESELVQPPRPTDAASNAHHRMARS